MRHFLHPQNVGVLADASGEGTAGSLKAGVFMRIQVRTEQGAIREAAFKTYGCVPAIAAGSFITEWSKGRSIEDALSLDTSTVITGLGGLPPDRRFCAELAVEALHNALHDARRRDVEDGP